MAEADLSRKPVWQGSAALRFEEEDKINREGWINSPRQNEHSRRANTDEKERERERERMQENSVENRATTACIKWFTSLNFPVLNGVVGRKNLRAGLRATFLIADTAEAVKVSLGWKRSCNGKQREKNKEDR
jgi:hypothetical protein